MPASEFQKKALFFFVFSGIVTLILILLPFAESLLLSYLNIHFGITITPDGKVIGASGVSEPGMMTETAFSLFINIFHIIKIFLWMALVIVIVRFVSYLLFTKVFRNIRQSEVGSLVSTVFSIIIYIVSFFIIFQSQYPGIQLTPLFTGSTILGIVVGLAMQDTLGNLFAGMALQADQPFQVGDVVVISNRGSGVVESVSWRGVRIRTFQNKLLVLSNAVMGKETIEVAPRDNLNARIVHFSTLYSNSPARTINLVREAVRQVENVSPKIRPVVRIRDFAESGLDWEIKYWVDDYTKYNDTDAQIRQRIWYLFNREGIQFPFPTRTIYHESGVEAPTDVEYVNTTSEQLHTVPIFAPLSNDELERLAKASTLRVFAPGELIVRRGREGHSMFVITRGSVKVQIPDRGIPKTINKLSSNEFFGEMSLLTGQPRSANVIAEEETEVLQIKKTALKPLFEENPGLMKSICEIVEERQHLLTSTVPDERDITLEPEKGVLTSIKKFFGLD